MNNIGLRQGFILAVLIISVLIVYGILRYPRIVSEAGMANILFPLIMLLLYGVAAIWATHQPSPARHEALKSGTVFGLIVGGIFVVLITIENFVPMSEQVSTFATLSFMLLIFLIFAYAGWCGTKNSNQLSLGLLTSIWSAMCGVMIAVLFGFAINFLFGQVLEQNLQVSAEYLRSGSHDLETFTFWNTLDSASSHLLEAPILALVFGTCGSLLGLGLMRLGKSLRGSQRQG